MPQSSLLHISSCGNPGDGPGDCSTGTTPGQCHRGWRRGGHKHWVQSLSRQRQGMTCSQTCSPFLSQPWCFELAQCSRSSMVLDIHIWTHHYFCGRLQILFPINTSRTWLHFMLKYSIWKHVFQNPVKTQWLKYNTQIFRLLQKFKHIQWIKQGIQRQLEIPRGISRYIKAELLAIYSFQLLCSVVLAS